MDWIYRLPYRDWAELEASEIAPKAARRRLMGDLEEWSLGQFEVSATLVLSEIVTNAVFAANALVATAIPPPIKVWLLGGPSAVVLLVWDPSAEPPVRCRAEDTDESGRGLTIIEQLSAQWGYYPVEAGGKVTWATIDSPLPESLPVVETCPCSGRVGKQVVVSRSGALECGSRQLTCDVTAPTGSGWAVPGRDTP